MTYCGENDFVNGFKTKRSRVFDIALNCLKNGFIIRSNHLLMSDSFHGESQVSYCKNKNHVVGFKFQLVKGFFNDATNIILLCNDGLNN